MDAAASLQPEIFIRLIIAYEPWNGPVTVKHHKQIDQSVPSIELEQLILEQPAVAVQRLTASQGQANASTPVAVVDEQIVKISVL